MVTEIATPKKTNQKDTQLLLMNLVVLPTLLTNKTVATSTTNTIPPPELPTTTNDTIAPASSPPVHIDNIVQILYKGGLMTRTTTMTDPKEKRKQYNDM